MLRRIGKYLVDFSKLAPPATLVSLVLTSVFCFTGILHASLAWREVMISEVATKNPGINPGGLAAVNVFKLLFLQPVAASARGIA